MKKSNSAAAQHAQPSEKKITFSVFLFFAATIVIFLFSFFFENTAKQAFRFFLSLSYQPAKIEAILDGMRGHADFFGEAAVTAFSVMTSFLIFYYTALSTMHYGLSNRKLISYTIGSLYIPLLTVNNAASTLFTFFGFYCQNYVMFYGNGVNLCVGLIVQMFLCIYATSSSRSVRVIVKAEKYNYERFCWRYDEGGVFALDEERDSNRLLYHAHMVLSSNESMPEKAEVFRELLLIPYINTENQPAESRYFYVCSLMEYLVRQLESQPENMEYIFDMLTDDFSCLIEKCEKTAVMEYLGALYYLLLPYVDNTEKRNADAIPGDAGTEHIGPAGIYGFFRNILNKMVDEKHLRAELTMEFLDCMRFLWQTERLSSDNGFLVRDAEDFLLSIDLTELNRKAPEEDEYLKKLSFLWTSYAADRRTEDYIRLQSAAQHVARYGELCQISYLRQRIWDTEDAKG